MFFEATGKRWKTELTRTDGRDARIFLISQSSGRFVVDARLRMNLNFSFLRGPCFHLIKIHGVGVSVQPVRILQAHNRVPGTLWKLSTLAPINSCYFFTSSFDIFLVGRCVSPLAAGKLRQILQKKYYLGQRRPSSRLGAFYPHLNMQLLQSISPAAHLHLFYIRRIRVHFWLRFLARTEISCLDIAAVAVARGEF